ncbi:ubiquitin fusion degradation protein [Thraustotheca clavata]|uniref:Ubiquitin fusion degradation protein n=1 Tax=Thraustotheca clavata TaxID=74557 RepID=A0A1V9ZLH4_9STRA|nr:ubiquitin fusion degradation protein [Thraustotheca clavata]
MFFGQGANNPFGLNFGFGANFPQRFDEHYRVYPVSFCDKAHLEDGDKILLPPSALETLARLHIEYPMLFKVKNEAVNRVSHCGVLEFSAPEGSCFMPYWMMQNMFLTEGSIVNIQNVTLPKATFVKIRPQSKDFLDISNPRAVLEASLRKFSCMTVGDTICLKYNDRNYLLDVREIRPADAASIIETDCEVDFEAPADYVPPAPPSSTPAPPAAPTSSLPFGGVPTMKKDDLAHHARPVSRGLGGLRMKKGSGTNTDAEALRAARLKKYEAFHGTGVSLTGATSTYTAASTLAASSAPKPKEEEEEKKEPEQKPFEGLGRRLR